MTHPPDDDTETFEQIPWSHLMTAHREGRNRTVLAVGGVAVGLLAAFVVGGLLRGGGPSQTVVTLPPATKPATAGVVDATTTTQLSTTLPLFTEADLMAAVPDDTTGIAGVAEWYVIDYFSVEAGGPSASFVQWARALEVAPSSDGYRVIVVFGALGAGEDGRYRRMPVRAVEVHMLPTTEGWVPDGIPLIAPVPIELPDRDTGALGSGPIPDEIRMQAEQVAGGWVDVTVQGGVAGPGGWEVVVEVGDGAGNRWPLHVLVAG